VDTKSGEHSGRPSGEATGEHSPGHRWLTYSELGRVRGIGRESAVKLAQRKRWRRVPGNDGEARVAVPQDWLAPAKEPSGDHSPEQPPNYSGEHSPDLSNAVRALEGAIASLTDRAINAEKRADRAEIRADSAETRMKQAEQALTERQKQADRAPAAIRRGTPWHGHLLALLEAADSVASSPAPRFENPPAYEDRPDRGARFGISPAKPIAAILKSRATSRPERIDRHSLAEW
jgi:hypothetical protein